MSAAAAVVICVFGAPAARAATGTATSTNWAGYAATRSGVTFRHVSATWVQPAVTCTPGAATYSSTWVGLGGNSAASPALEQIGTEGDCSPSGTPSFSMWYELVPDVSHRVKLTVKAGESVHASVAVSGHRVTLAVANLTRGTSFTKTLHATAVDTKSAEWIVEAPSLCVDTSLSGCQTGALANFGTTTFSRASATTAAGHTGTISDSSWDATTIDLAAGPGGRRFAAARRTPGAAAGAAATAPLDATGSSFSITFQQSTAPTAVPTADPGVPDPSVAARRHG
jgi:hypothetical protein